jgi:hypothetical protein
MDVSPGQFTCIMDGLQVSHAPRQLWPRDASAAPRQLQPLGVDSLTDEQAIERLQCLSSVRARLLRHQRRYDRIMGRMLTRLQVSFVSRTSQLVPIRGSQSWRMSETNDQWTPCGALCANDR